MLLLFLLYCGLSFYVSANKAYLIRKSEAEISRLINGSATISDLSVSVFNNFPYLAIELKKIDVRDSLFNSHGHHFFYAERLFLRLNPLKLITANISINKLEVDSASIYLFTDTTGYSNAYLLQAKTKDTSVKTPSSGRNILDKITIRRTSVTIDDRSKAKLFDVYIRKLDVKTNLLDSVYYFHLNESFLVRTLAFNLPIGSYLTNQLVEGDYTLHYSPVKKEFGFDSIPINIAKHPFRMWGHFSFGHTQQFSLRVDTRQISVDLAKRLLTKKTAKGISLVDVKAPLDATASLNGSLTGGNPLIVATWTTAKNAITTPLLSFDSCSFNGLYTNEVVKGLPRNDDNSKVEISRFRGNWKGLTMFSDRILINNLTWPILSVDLHSRFMVSQLNAVLQTDALSLTAGSGRLEIGYKGPFDHITPQNASLNGSLHIENGNILMQASQSNLTAGNASIRFVNADMLIDSLSCRIHNDPVVFRGKAVNALALLGDASGDIGLTLNMTAPVLNIDSLSSILYRKLPARKEQTSTQKGVLAKTVQQIDNLLSSGNISINLDAGKLIYRRFEARAANAHIVINGNSWILERASLQHGTGRIAVTGSITEQAGSHFGLNAAMKMTNVDAQKVWYGFEDFGIPSLSYKNIRGILSADAKVFLLLNKSGNFDMRTLKGEIDFSIKKGALIHFKPLEDVRAFVFKNRDFSEISFAEIKDKLSFSNGVVTINRMEINSTVLSLFVEGYYGLTGNTDISIQLPLSNLKKRKADYVPENTGTGGGGMSVFLRAKTGDDGTIKIKYDPFKRFRKQ
jgi:hypothetical protein